ncbi:MAG TPA: SGNH/GDSL hydrolase family protein [Terracidiphilus sp.]|nr:SGNH/GDSL hydrolase family protein [Terracidiphilus sp.]
MPVRWSKVIALVAAFAVSTVCAGQNAMQGGTKTAWVGTWAASPMEAQGSNMKPFALSTLRQIVHISNGGEQVRIRLTNAYGTDSLAIADVHVAVSAGGSSIKPETDHIVTFGGATGVRLAPGAEMYSDAVPIIVAPLSDLAISIYVPNQVMRAETYHQLGLQTNYLVDGDQSNAPTLGNATTLQSWYFLDGVDVPAVDGSRAVVTLGDSITDGALSTPDSNHRWPDMLAARLKQEHGFENVAVLNQGISGNRVLNQGAGPSAVARVDRDVLAQNGVKYLIVLDSINDIGRLASKNIAPEDQISASDLEYGLRQLADAAHLHGIKIYGATLTPYGGAGYSSDKGEQVREAVNQWIRSSGTFDGVVDFDKITQDPANPTHFNPAYDSGDHLHPNDAGYKAMADGIDLKLFTK